MREIAFRVDALRGGAPFTTLRFADAPTVTAERDAEIHMTLRGTFLHDDAVDWLSDEIMPVMVEDGAEYPLGVYRAATVTRREDASGVAWDEVEAYDRAVVLTWTRTEAREYWPAGTRYDAIIAHYLQAAGIVSVNIDATDEVLATDREEWEIGTAYLEIINGLLGELAFAPLWFNASGAAQLHAYAPPTASAITHQYREASGARVLFPGYSAEADVFDAPNVWSVVVDNPEYDAPMTAAAENDVPQNALSTVARGMRIPRVVRLNEIASQEALDAYAEQLRDEGMQAEETAEIETRPEGGHGIGDTVAVSLGSLCGIFREEAWTIEMRHDGAMRHTLSRFVGRIIEEAQ